MTFSTDQVTVTRTATINGYSVTETATAALPDRLVLDEMTELGLRQMLAGLLFDILPSVQASKLIIPCKTPLNSPN